MPRYNRDDYSACDWRATKSDILRCKKALQHQRRVKVSTVLGIVMTLIVIAITLEGIYKLYN